MHLSLPSTKTSYPHHQQGSDDSKMDTTMPYPSGTVSSSLVTADSQYNHDPSLFYGNNSSSSSSNHYSSSISSSPSNVNTQMGHHHPSNPTQQQQQPSYLASMQPSTVPLISSPLALNYNSQPTATSSSSSSANGSSNRTTGYSFRSRNRRDSFQNANNTNSMAFSPPSSYNSPSIASSLALQSHSNGSYSNQRYTHLLSPIASGSVTTGLGSNNSRARCLSSSSVDSNASTSTFGFSRLTPAMASMSVQQQQQASATNSPYQSYSSSPQNASGFNHHYQSSVGSSMYPYQSQYAQVTYGSFSTAASAVYEASSPIAQTSDMLYSTGSSHFGHVTSTPSQSYQGSPRASFMKHDSTTSPYSHTSIAGSPPYYEQDPTRLLQQLELSSPTATSGSVVSRSFDHHSSYGHHHAQSSNEYGSYNADSGELGDHSQNGLGIIGGMVGAEADNHNNPNNGSAPTGESTSEEPRMVLGDDGKTQLFPCGQCEKVFTTKSNLKRHLENVNIHNTPYERRRDQKRWQGHEKKHASREETTMRMRRWREANREKNKFNDMRCRVYRIAKDKFGLEDTDEKEAWIQAEIEKRKGMLLLRHSRKAEWKGMNLNSGSSSNAHDGSGSLGDGNKYPAGSSTSPFFLYGSAPQITGYDAQGQPIYSSSQPEAYKDTSLKDGDRTFIELLKSEHVPRRRRSRQAMNATVTKAQPFNQTVPSNAPESNIVGSSEVMNDEHYAPFGLMKGTLSSSSLLGLDQGISSSNFDSSVSLSQRGPPAQKKRRNRKQRSISEKKSMFRRRLVAGTGSTSLPGTGSSGIYGTTYLETDQRLQDLYQGYQTRSLSQALLLNKNQERAQTSSSAMEAIVSDLEIGHSKQSNTSSSGTASGLYGDRTELSWIDWQNPQPASATSNPGINGTRQYPFPEMALEPTHSLRDRKGLAKAAGIKIDIPSHQNQLSMNPDWIMMEVSGGDDMVGGSATSVASSANSQLKSPLSAASSMQSPMLGFGAHDSSKGLSPETHSPSGTSSTKARVVHKAASHEMFSGLPSTASSTQYPYQSFYGASLTVSGQSQQPSLAQQAQVRSLALARSQGLASNSTSADIDYFTTLVLPGAGDISVSSAGNNSATSAGSSVPNYLAKQQVNLRRHSTQLSNLSTCLPTVTMGMNMGESPTGLARSALSGSSNGESCGPNDNNPSSLLPEIASLIAESDQERAREQAKKQHITVPMGPGTLAATFYPFPTSTAAPNNNTFSGIYTPFTFGATGNPLPSIPDRVLGNDRSKLITPAHPHTMGDIMLTVGGNGAGMDVIGIDKARKNPLDDDNDDAMNEDSEEYQMNAPSGQTHGIGGTSATMNAVPGALQSSTSELMHDLMNQIQMIPEDSNMFGVEGDSSLAPSGMAPSSSFKGTHRITRSSSSFASISRMSVDSVSTNTTPVAGAGALGASDMERSGSSGWWPGSGSQMSSTPTTSTTTATVIATSQSKTTLSSSLSALSTAPTPSSGTGSGASVVESSGRTAGHSNKNPSISKKSLSEATGAVQAEFAPSSKVEKSKNGSEKRTSANKTIESAKKPPLSLTGGFSKQHKKSGSNGASLGSLFSSSFSNMTASLTSKKKRHSNSSLSQQFGDSTESAQGQEKSEKRSNKGEKHSLSSSPSSTAFRPGHPGRSSSILDEFAEVMLNIATKKP